MSLRGEAIEDNSVWLSATPGGSVKRLPFYLTETGHFYAMKEYVVEREFHDSFMFIYTIRGRGRIITDNTELELGESRACVINCRKPHRYWSESDKWEFIWFHFNGGGAEPLYEALYQSGIRSAPIDDSRGMERSLAGIMASVSGTDLMTGLNVSSEIHGILNLVFESLTAPSDNGFPHHGDIVSAAEYIRSNFASPIVIDDIAAEVHMSKYHFIRLFHRIMGISPYSYITVCRINRAKTLLHSTDRTVAEIGSECGFADTSNFINHFKKHTGQTPLKYRRDFGGII